MKLAIPSLLLTSALLSGCASVIKGQQDTITVNSLEKGSAIFIDGVQRGVDDALAQVKKGNPHTIKATKEGCQAVIIQTGESFDATSLLGILIDFGIITIPIDLISGAAWQTEPTIYTVTPICKA